MADARLRASRIRGLIAAENEAWDRATEQRADAEYALEQFEESEDRQDLSEDEAEERCEQLRAIVRKAREWNRPPSAPGTKRGSAQKRRSRTKRRRASGDERARCLVEENWLAVVAVADALLRKRTLERAEFLEIQQVRWITWWCMRARSAANTGRGR